MGSTKRDSIRDTPLQYEAFDGQLELVCRTCQKKSKYSVGRIFIDRAAMRRVLDEEIPYAEAVFFSGCFRCKKCGLGGPWDIPKYTQARLTLLQIAAAGEMTVDKKTAPIQFGALQLFDGTLCHSGGEGEAYLRRLIEADPADYFLWSRLGNLFSVAEDPDQAFPAFQKAIELNSHDLESHHSLAEIYRARGELDQAADHYHQVLLNARHAPPRTQEKHELLRNIVRHALECLLELHHETGKRIEFLPTRPEATDSKEAVLVLKQYDLSREEDWERLTNSFLSSVSAAHPPIARRRRERSFSGYRFPAEPAHKAHVGRNDPCPCGSGKKFKKCCSR